MSYDFAVLLPELVGSIEDARRLHLAMCHEVIAPSTSIIEEFLTELDAKWGFAQADDGCILTAASSPDARGTVVCTSWRSVAHNQWVLLEMTRDRGLMLYDPQCSRLFDPRGHLRDVDVELGNGTRIPYLSPALLASLVDRPDEQWPWLIITRAEQHYIQSHFPAGEPVEVEHRDGGPDRHFRASTPDRALARSVLWEWAVETPGWGDPLTWQRIKV